jgi:hypothetical protein
MSKKNKKKFKRNKFNQSPTSASSVQESMSDASESDVTAPATEATIKSEKPMADDPYSNNEYDHVRKDVRKILFIISILALIFVAVWLIGTKTGVLTSFGDWIYKIANIQTQ